MRDFATRWKDAVAEMHVESRSSLGRNAWLTAAFRTNRKQIFNVVIFKELLKSLASVLEP